MYAASTLPLITDMAELLPDTSRSVEDRRLIADYMGSTALFVVVVRAKGQDADARARQSADALAAALESDEEFDYVYSGFDTSFFERNALLYVSLERLRELRVALKQTIDETIIDRNPLFVDLLEDEEGEGEGEGDGASTASADEDESKDFAEIRRLIDEIEEELTPPVPTRTSLIRESEATYLVISQPRVHVADVEYSENIISRLDGHIAALDLRRRFGPDLEFFYTGNHWGVAEEKVATQSDLRRSGAVSLGLLLVFVGLYFRRLRAIWVIFIPLGSGIAMMMGYIKLAVGSLNTFTGFIFALFMGLSIDFAIHLLARYDEERGGGQEVLAALTRTYRETGRALLAAVTTSAAGFLAMVAADYKGFYEFGVIASGGIAICFGAIAVQMPAVIALSQRFSREKHFARFRRHSRVATAATSRLWPRLVAVVAGVAVVGTLAYQSRALEWEDDFRNLRGGSKQTLETALLVFEIMGYSTQPVIWVTPNLSDARKLSRACDREREAPGNESEVLFCASLGDFLPEHQKSKLAVIAELRALLSDNRLAAIDDQELYDELKRMRDEAPTAAITRDTLPPWIVSGFVSPEGDRYYVKAFHGVDAWKMSNHRRVADKMREFDDVVDSDVGPVGLSIIYTDMLEVIGRDGLVVGILSLVMVFTALMLIYRSLAYALSCFVTLAVGLACTAGLMALVGIKLGLYNMLIVPLLIGVGVDNIIHLFHRYRSEGRGSWRHILGTTGGACVMASTTTIAGFAGLLFATHLGLRSIGYLSVVGIATCTAVAVVLMPLCFSVLERVARGNALGFLPPEQRDTPDNVSTSSGSS